MRANLIILYHPRNKRCNARLACKRKGKRLSLSTKVKYSDVILGSLLLWKSHVNDPSKRVTKLLASYPKPATTLTEMQFCHCNFASFMPIRFLDVNLFGVDVISYVVQEYICLAKICNLPKSALRTITSSEYHNSACKIAA